MKTCSREIGQISPHRTGQESALARIRRLLNYQPKYIYEWSPQYNLQLRLLYMFDAPHMLCVLTIADCLLLM